MEPISIPVPNFQIKFLRTCASSVFAIATSESRSQVFQLSQTAAKLHASYDFVITDYQFDGQKSFAFTTEALFVSKADQPPVKLTTIDAETKMFSAGQIVVLAAGNQLTFLSDASRPSITFSDPVTDVCQYAGNFYVLCGSGFVHMIADTSSLAVSLPNGAIDQIFESSQQMMFRMADKLYVFDQNRKSLVAKSKLKFGASVCYGMQKNTLVLTPAGDFHIIDPMMNKTICRARTGLFGKTQPTIGGSYLVSADTEAGQVMLITPQTGAIARFPLLEQSTQIEISANYLVQVSHQKIRAQCITDKTGFEIPVPSDFARIKFGEFGFCDAVIVNQSAFFVFKYDIKNSKYVDQRSFNMVLSHAVFGSNGTYLIEQRKNIYFLGPQQGPILIGKTANVEQAVAVSDLLIVYSGQNLVLFNQTRPIEYLQVDGRVGKLCVSGQDVYYGHNSAITKLNLLEWMTQKVVESPVSEIEDVSFGDGGKQLMVMAPEGLMMFE